MPRIDLPEKLSVDFLEEKLNLWKLPFLESLAIAMME